MPKKKPTSKKPKKDLETFVSDPDYVDPSENIIREATDAIEKMVVQIQAGDQKVINTSPLLACLLIDALEEIKEEVAPRFPKWPAVFSADPVSRKKEASEILDLEIGGKKAGGRGRPRNDDYSSEWGFAVVSLRGLEVVRNTLISLSPEGSDSLPLDPETLQNFCEAMNLNKLEPDAQRVIVGLPDYSADSRSMWIDAIVGILKTNPHLVPPERANIATTVHDPPPELAKNIPVQVERRGGQIKKSLTRALKNVNTIPGFLGQK